MPRKFRWTTFGLLAITILDLELFNERKREKEREKDKKEETLYIMI